VLARAAPRLPHTPAFEQLVDVPLALHVVIVLNGISQHQTVVMTNLQILGTLLEITGLPDLYVISIAVAEGIYAPSFALRDAILGLQAFAIVDHFSILVLE
jgi:hypothetical protein